LAIPQAAPRTRFPSPPGVLLLAGFRAFRGAALELAARALLERPRRVEGAGVSDRGGKDKMIYLTRRAEFSASHFYHNPDLSPEENRRIFGKCNNPHGHGHNYTVEVTIAGEVNPTTGMVLDLKDLKKVLEAEVLQLMDHRFLNKEVPAFGTKIPTTENIAIEIWKLLAPNLNFARLHRIRLYETPDLYVDY